MSSIIKAVAARRWIAWTFLLLMTAPAVVGLFRLEFADEPRLLLDETDPEAQQVRELSEAFGLDARKAVLVVQADDVFSREASTALRDLVDDVEQIAGVGDTQSLLDIPRFDRPKRLADRPWLAWLASLLPRPLVPGAGAEMLSGAGAEILADARQAALAHPLASGLLLSEDARTTLVIAHLEGVERGSEQARPAVKRLQRLADRYSQKTALSVRVTGVTPIRLEILKALRTQMWRILLLAVAVALGVAIVLFRQLLPAVIAGGGAGLGVVWTLGAMGLAGQPLDLVNNVLPTLVLVIGFTDGVHLLFEFRRAKGRGDSPSTAAVLSVKRVGRACALTSLTTAIGFGSLAIAKADIIRQFGLAAAAAAVLIFLAVVISVPLACSTRLGGRIRADRRTDESTGWTSQFFFRLGAWTVRWRRSVAVAGLILAVVAGSTAFKLKPSNRLTDALPAGSEAEQALQHVDQVLGGILSAQVVVEWTEKQSALSPQVLSAMRATHEAARRQGVRPWSLVNLIDTLPKEYRLLLPLVDLEELVFQQRAERVVQPERRQAMVHLRLPDWGTAKHAEVFEELRQELRQIEKRHSGVRLKLTGTTVLAAENVGRVMQDLGGSIGLAAALISLVMACGFRSVRLGLICAPANLLPLCMTAAVIYFSGGDVTLTALMVFSVCLGIAADDTIHLLNGLRHQRQERDRSGAVIGAVRQVGPALATSTLVLLAGFGTATLSSIPTTQSFARLASVAIAAALLADVLALPALLAWFGPSPDHVDDDSRLTLP